MKKILLALALSFAAYAQGQNTACHSPAGAQENTVTVSGTSAVTFAPSVGGQDIHLCLIEFTNAPAGTVTIQGSDGTVLSSDTVAQGTYYFTWWDGQLTTRRAAQGSSMQILFSVVPSPAIKVTVTYYQSPANRQRQ